MLPNLGSPDAGFFRLLPLAIQDGTRGGVPTSAGSEPKIPDAARWANFDYRPHYADVRVISRIRSFVSGLVVWCLVPISKGENSCSESALCLAFRWSALPAAKARYGFGSGRHQSTTASVTRAASRRQTCRICERLLRQRSRKSERQLCCASRSLRRGAANDRRRHPPVLISRL